MTDKRPDGIENYSGPAGGWDALRATAEALIHEKIVLQGLDDPAQIESA